MLQTDKSRAEFHKAQCFCLATVVKNYKLNLFESIQQGLLTLKTE